MYWMSEFMSEEMSQHKFFIITMARNWTQGPEPLPCWSVPWSLPLFLPDRPFLLFYLQVWILAVLAEGKISYKTLISFSLIPFFNKDFFLSLSPNTYKLHVNLQNNTSITEIACAACEYIETPGFYEFSEI